MGARPVPEETSTEKPEQSPEVAAPEEKPPEVEAPETLEGEPEPEPEPEPPAVEDLDGDFVGIPEQVEGGYIQG
jgi:hypothetical protein